MVPYKIETVNQLAAST